MMILSTFFVLLQIYDSTGFATSDSRLVPLHRHRRKAISSLRYRWTNGVIPYEFLNGHFNATEKDGIREAMKIWSDETCLTFRPATRGDRNKVAFRDGTSCYSMLGMIGGRQYITLKRSCRTLGLELHEIGHAIGLVHEHQLPSRDEHINVHLGNVYSGAHAEFQRLKPHEVNDYGVPYDLTSIMHYGRTAFTANHERKTIEAKDPNKNHHIQKVSHRTKLSFSDVKVVNLMYNCSKHCASNIACPSPGFLDKNCECVQPVYIEYCRNREAKCEEWKKRNQCKENKIYMEFNCPISCGYCSPRDGLTDEVFPTEPPKPPKEIDCRDKDSQCQGWAATSHCTLNKGYMHDQCPVACGICQPRGGRPTTPPPTEGPCANTHKSDADCTKWAKRGECQVNPEFMLKQCRRSCGQCSEGGTTEVATGGHDKEECKNNHGETKCKEWADLGECRGNPEFMLKQCAKACGQCGGSTTSTTKSPQPGCKNSYPEAQCIEWFKKGECQFNPGFMLTRCAKACGKCDKNSTQKNTSTSTAASETEGSDCVNSYGDSECEAWAKDEQCEKNPSFMLKRCAKSCSACGNESNSEEEKGGGESQGTNDEEEEQQDQKEGGKEEEEEKEEKEEEKEKEVKEEGKEEKEEKEEDKEKEEIEKEKEEEEEEKEEEDKEEESTPQTTPAPACTNRYHDSQCEAWAKGDQCRRNPGFMLKQCARSCNSCPGQSNSGKENGKQNKPTTSAPNCRDRASTCASWAKAGYCRTNGYTIKNCKKSCGTC